VEGEMFPVVTLERKEEERLIFMSDVLSKFLVTHHASPMFPQLKLLICVYLVLTIHTTEAERGFRCMNIIKTRERSRLSQERLEQLMHVRMSDVSPSNITEKQLLLWVTLWYETKARRFVHLDSSIVKPDPEFDQLAKNAYVFGKSASQQDVAKYEAAAVKPVENRDQFNFSSISGDIKPTEKEASKLPQILKKIGKPDLQPKNAGNLLLTSK
jgi:hypothetical protein